MRTAGSAFDSLMPKARSQCVVSLGIFLRLITLDDYSTKRSEKLKEKSREMERYPTKSSSVISCKPDKSSSSWQRKLSPRGVVKVKIGEYRKDGSSSLGDI
ncbi:hypothetical protein V1477_006491 [Vespula maculifrons]|uniref:Uncharacterized protein n=1 Tax=Vespula maculifrons TaxID=7453 RepID=A0ABD2CIZ7_VESMC